MTWQHLFAVCREVNGPLGIAAFICLGYRAVIGLHDHEIVYRPLFVLFALYVFVAALGAPVSIAVENEATFLSPTLTALHVALIVFCVFYPGLPARKRT